MKRILYTLLTATALLIGNYFFSNSTMEATIETPTPVPTPTLVPLPVTVMPIGGPTIVPTPAAEINSLDILGTFNGSASLFLRNTD
jgi:hypothetical protein